MKEGRAHLPGTTETRSDFVNAEATSSHFYRRSDEGRIAKGCAGGPGVILYGCELPHQPSIRRRRFSFLRLHNLGGPCIF